MSKRRRDDDELVNVLRQRQKEDTEEKARIAQSTFAILMGNAQRSRMQSPKSNEPSYALFNNPDPNALRQSGPKCHHCSRENASICCAFCEHNICCGCTQICIVCEQVYCGACSTIDYSTSVERIFCLTCKNG